MYMPSYNCRWCGKVGNHLDNCPVFKLNELDHNVDELLNENKKLKQENERLIGFIESLVSQDCSCGQDELDSMAISIYAESMKLLADLGKLKITHESGRRVIGKWIKEAKK